MKIGTIDQWTVPDLPAAPLVQIGDMMLDRERRLLSRGNKKVVAGGQFDIRLWLLFGKYPNQALPEERLVPVVWGEELRGRGTLKTYIHRCRRTLCAVGSHCRIINHHYGTYEFVVPPSKKRPHRVAA